ncbi:MAG TPA: GNAT family N-acetyltransferase [Polyangiaceae bacterium]|nr:GNAT family N-acetyltransferase [Polyangiaceae bacterium]
MIRPATPADAAAMAALHVRAWQVGYRGQIPDAELDALDPAERALRWTKTLADPSVTVLVAVDGAAVVGFCSFRASGDADGTARTGEIKTLYVEPERWRSGFGSALLARALAGARERGFEEVTLWVLGTNTNARSFYEAHDFTPDGGLRTEKLPTAALHEVRYRRRVQSLE